MLILATESDFADQHARKNDCGRIVQNVDCTEIILRIIEKLECLSRSVFDENVREQADIFWSELLNFLKTYMISWFMKFEDFRKVNLRCWWDLKVKKTCFFGPEVLRSSPVECIRFSGRDRPNPIFRSQYSNAKTFFEFPRLPHIILLPAKLFRISKTIFSWKWKGTYNPSQIMRFSEIETNIIHRWNFFSNFVW